MLAGEARPGRVKLGLVGDNIRASRSPALHRICGALSGLEVSYDLYIPPHLGLTFEETFSRCLADGLAGFNVTLPYKERVMRLVEVADPNIARIGAVNAVKPTAEGARGFNTDYSGFISAFRAAFGERKPGIVALIGGGGVGKAIAFALVVLGADEIRVVDRDLPKAEALARALSAAGAARAVAEADVQTAMAGADGAVNGTPLGMTGYPGSPAKDADFAGQSWAFDAVYTPAETLFKRQAEAAGLDFISGYELFFHQGVDAFEIFTGTKVSDLDTLRRRLLLES
ncbi:Quinate/shikimate dehydrogenase (NAD(+)) [Nitratireductor thuwali]|uniref:Quinate/shikimate dehydrogenase (NAD(+)) n=2 Tax=Nitratireductor thuwali TaxID=2267699 RepID=A0ABY5MIB6_9HYPH|nr:Quinate/shikimate dehydrogenase (NAD(+)) [Nitratireductor thuwali]